jgi:hypothetical protein
MAITKQRTLDYLEHEWGSYVERFQQLPDAEQTRRVKKMGYASLQDLLAHILAWWEEGMGIIIAIAEERAFERKRYDFDAFNAQAVTKYKSWEDQVFMAYFESTRQKMEAELRSLDEAVFENRRVRTWLNGILFLHAREHLFTPSRFLLTDLLQNEWLELPRNFERLEEERKQEFLSKQGYQTFHDFLAHILGWWEEGMRVIHGILEQPGFTWTEQEADSFNHELVQKYSSWSDEDLFRHYDSVRQAMIDLIAGLPADAFQNQDIESWLVEDVVEHYDGHALPQ